MNAVDLIAALDLPPGARVDQRVPKKLLVENGAPTAADKRRINVGIEDVRWLAALKPTTIGVPEFRDPIREYLEIAVLSAVLRSGAETNRLSELIHRAVPYPVLLLTSYGDTLAVSLAHKRWSHGETGVTILDGLPVTATLNGNQHNELRHPFGEALPLARQPRGNLYTLYQGWMDTVLALLAAQVTGSFAAAESPEKAETRRSALAECARLETQMAGVRADVVKEKQLARQIELNLKLKRMEAAQAAARAKL